VLGKIAWARGVNYVAGTDIDLMAWDVARQNAKLDSLSSRVHFGKVSPDFWGRFSV
jgi:ribosomal protein L11 methylase PrmA